MDEKSSHSPVTSQPEESAGYGEKALPNYNGNDVQTEGLISEDFDGLKRELSGRQIQMVTIGGSIGTALFVSIGSGLTQGGPASLFIAFILYSCFLGLVNNCMAEMSVFMPGAFAEYVTTGSLGRFEGFLAALWKAAFTIVGPEYIAMMSGEAAHPRKNLKRAFKTIYWRFGVFFIGGALACGIVIPYNDKKLIAYLSAGGSETGTAASSPYVIAMQNLGIGVLPHITNALLVTSIFSAGNSYVYVVLLSY
ncbi:hypothetical protein ACHAQE_009790 [Botrytis cinerea]